MSVFQSKAPVVIYPTQLYGWLGMCAPIKLNFFFFAKEDRFLMLFQTCIKLTFGLSDTLVITVIGRNRINSVSSLFFRDRK